MILEFDDDPAAIACNRLLIRPGRVAVLILCHDDLPDNFPIISNGSGLSRNNRHDPEFEH
jgi:hypothetical protein